MSSFAPNFLTPSQDFVTLCQSQVTLLTQGLKADWSAIYLAQESEAGQQTDLIPLVFYPTKEDIWSSKNLNSLALPNSSEPLNKLPRLLLGKSSTVDPNGEQAILDSSRRFSQDPYRLVLPLIHTEIMVGLLVTERKNCPWQPEELTQVETIAKTLAIAGLLDRRQNWYQEQLRQQQGLKVQERDRLDDLFHQLRNPLTALRIFSKLLLKRLKSDEKSRSIVDSIIRESDHLQELIQAFEGDQDTVTLNAKASLSCASLPSATSRTLSPVNIKDVLDPLLISIKSIAQEKQIDLKADIPRDLPSVYANSQALREVLNNLIDNAIKYTPKGGQVRVELGLISIIDQKTYQGILIEDTGYGIPLEDQAHIFDRHYRGIQAEGDISGTGLGLAIVKDLVNQMEGIIEVFSPINAKQKKGTRFMVWLPLSQEGMQGKLI